MRNRPIYVLGSCWIWTSQCRACSSSLNASNRIFVHQLACLFHASFGPLLASKPLRFTNPSPPSGWVEDFHFLAAGHAQHTLPGCVAADCNAKQAALGETACATTI